VLRRIHPNARNLSHGRSPLSEICNEPQSGTFDAVGGRPLQQVSRLCEEIDERVQTFLSRPIEGRWPYLWIDATYVKGRENGRVVSRAVIVAVGANAEGRREVLGMTVGPSEAETFWTEFLRSLTRRGLEGVELVISDAHEGIKAAVSRVFCATWQRCRVHFMRNVMAHAGKSGSRMVSAFIATAFAQDDAKAAKAQWRGVANQLRTKLPKLAELLDDAEADVLAYMTFPPAHRQKIHSTNALERLNGEIKRRTKVVGIFPNDAAITRLVGAVLLEQNDEWAIQRRYMTLETIARFSDDLLVSLPPTATDQPGPSRRYW
jgi:putative transposase